MSGILEQLTERVTRLEQMLAGGGIQQGVAAQQPVQQVQQPVQQVVAQQPVAQVQQVTGEVTADMVMGLVNPLVEIPAAQSELKGVVTGMGFTDLAQVPQASYGAIYVQFKAIYDRYFPAQAGGAGMGGLGGLGGGAVQQPVQQVAQTPSII